MKIHVEMVFPGIRFLGQEKLNDGIPAVASFTFAVKDKECPFCGKEMQGAKCCCQDFNAALKKLQESVDDTTHSSFVRVNGQNYASSFFDLTYQQVNKAGLDFDLFDDAFACKDIVTGKKYLVSEGTSKDGGEIEFYLKMLEDKTVYKFTAVCKAGENKIDYPTVDLVVVHKKMSPGTPGVYGSSYPYFMEETIRTFYYDAFIAALLQKK